jgi:hypothetical protein
MALTVAKKSASDDSAGSSLEGDSSGSSIAMPKVLISMSYTFRV